MNDNKLIKDIEKLAVNAVEEAYEKGYNRGYNAAAGVILGKPIIVDGPKGPITYYPVEEKEDE
tara:strand:+ start:104 stop:292 length:189 start_codon:yes stop_codon:yes gene_type:complete